MKINKRILLFGALFAISAVVFGIVDAVGSTGPAKVAVERTPGGGIQPQSVLDDKSVLHLIYFSGDPAAGDIYYVRRAPGAESFSEPVRVNSLPGSAIATGNVRGAHIAVGRGGRVHVAWMGSKEAEPRGPSGATPMLYTRMNDAGTAFEPQRNVMQFAVGLDGGGSVAADGSGNVYVVWHAGAGAEGEAKRRVWVARSSDEGKTFGREVAASDQALGACGCCGMRAFIAKDGTLYVLYRSATGGVDRDMYLLTSRDRGVSFTATLLDRWKLEACPMSTAAFAAVAGGVAAAWETRGQVYYAAVGPTKSQPARPVPAPGEAVRRRHPALVGNREGETLLVWTEGMVWGKGGSVAWQVFGADGRPAGEQGRAEGVPAWSLVTAYSRPDGGFTIIY